MMVSQAWARDVTVVATGGATAIGAGIGAVVGDFGIMAELLSALAVSTLAGVARAALSTYDGFRVGELIVDVIAKIVVAWAVGTIVWFLMLDRFGAGLRVGGSGLAALFAVEFLNAVGGRIDRIVEKFFPKGA